MDWLSPIRTLFEFFLPFLDRVPVIRAILGIIFVFFLPGFTWTLIFFKQINVIERIVLSIGLSIAVVTISLLFLHVLIGVRINGLNSLLIIILLTVIPVAYYYLNRFIRGRLAREE